MNAYDHILGREPHIVEGMPSINPYEYLTNAAVGAFGGLMSTASADIDSVSKEAHKQVDKAQQQIDRAQREAQKQTQRAVKAERREHRAAARVRAAESPLVRYGIPAAAALAGLVLGRLFLR